MNCYYYLITTEYEHKDSRYLLFRRNAELGLAIQNATKSVLNNVGIPDTDYKITKEGIYLSRFFIENHKEKLRGAVSKDDNSKWVLLSKSSDIMLTIKRVCSDAAIQFDIDNPKRIDLALFIYHNEDDKIGWGMSSKKNILIACEGECKELKKFEIMPTTFNKELKQLEYENVENGFSFL